jgi:hypothetical protein
LSKAEFPVEESTATQLRASQAAFYGEKCKIQNEPLRSDIKGEIQLCPRSSNSVGNRSQAKALKSVRGSGSDGGQRRNSVGEELSTVKLVRKGGEF